MIDELLKKLYQLFPLYPVPDPQGMSFPCDVEADDDCIIFRGKAWDQTEIEEYYIHWTAFLWLNTEYFHYYFPGIMLRSLQEIKYLGHLSKMELSVDTATSYISWDSDSDEKWKMFTYDQMDCIRTWYYFILNNENNYNKDECMQNINYLFQRLYSK